MFQYSLLHSLTHLSVTILTASPLSLLTTLFSSISFLLPRIIFSTSSFACWNKKNCDLSNQTFWCEICGSHSSAVRDDVFGDFSTVVPGKNFPWAAEITHPVTQHHIPEDLNLQTFWCTKCNWTVSCNNMATPCLTLQSHILITRDVRQGRKDNFRE